MVCLWDQVLRENRTYRLKYCPRKPAEELSKEEIIDYLENVRIPVNFASPFPNQDGEWIIGETGELKYYGVELDAKKSVEELVAEGAYRLGAQVNFNTYWNKVVIEADKRRIIKLRYEEKDKETGFRLPFLNDLMSLSFRGSLKRGAPALRKQLEQIREFEEKSRKSNIFCGVSKIRA